MTSVADTKKMVARIQAEVARWNLDNHNAATTVLLDVLQAQLLLVEGAIELNTHADMHSHIQDGVQNAMRVLHMLAPSSGAILLPPA